MSDFVVRAVTSNQDRESVFRLRYDVYVKEMGRSQTYADHKRSRIEEPLDQTGNIVAAFRNEAIVGTVRSNLLRLASSMGLYEELYGFAGLAKDVRPSTSLTTKLIVHSRFRSSSIALQLARAAFKYGLTNGVEDDFIDCNEHLVSFFIRLGYSVVKPITHPEYGDVVLLRLRLRDRMHLASIKSPLLRDLLSMEHHCQQQRRSIAV